MDSMTAYEVLGVSESATHEEIKKSYKKRVFETHPDKLPQGTPERVKKLAEEDFKDVCAAWEMVGNKEKRAKYDAYLGRIREDEARRRRNAEEDARRRAEAAARAAQAAGGVGSPQSANRQSHSPPPQPKAQTQAQPPATPHQPPAKKSREAVWLALFTLASCGAISCVFTFVVSRHNESVASERREPIPTPLTMQHEEGEPRRIVKKSEEQTRSKTATDERDAERQEPTHVSNPINAEKKEVEQESRPDLGSWIGRIAARVNRTLQSTPREGVETAPRNKKREVWPEPKRTFSAGGFDGEAELDHVAVYNNCVRSYHSKNPYMCREFLSVEEWNRIRDSPQDWLKMINGLPEPAQSWFVKFCKDGASGLATWPLCYSYINGLDDVCNRGANNPAGENDGVLPLIGSKECKLLGEFIAIEPKVCLRAKDSSFRMAVTTEYAFRFWRVRVPIKNGEYWYRGENGAQVAGYHNESGSTTYWQIPKAEGGDACRDAVDNY